MTTSHRKPAWVSKPWLFLLILLIGGVVGLLWLKSHDREAASALGPLLAIIVMASSLVFARRHERQLDEVQIASQGFAMNRGYVYGAVVTMLLLMLPPVTSGLVDLVYLQTGGSPDAAGRRAVRLAFIYGSCLVVLVQLLTFLAATVFWWRRMGGMRERAQ